MEKISDEQTVHQCPTQWLADFESTIEVHTHVYNA